MSRWVVDVHLALKRPPRHDKTSRVILMADTWIEAELLAIDIATGVHHCPMAVGSQIVDWDE